MMRVFAKRQELMEYQVSLLARTMKWLSVAVSLAACASVVALWTSPARLSLRLAPDVAQGLLNLDAATRSTGLLLSCPPLAILLFALWNTYRFFDDFEKGRLFGPGTGRQIRSIALSIGLLGAARPLLRETFDVLLVPGRTFALPMIGIGDLLTLFFAGIFFAIGLAFDQAARMRAEMDQIV